MVLLFCALALAASDHLGGQDVYNNNGDMLKLLVLDVDEAAVVTGLQFSLYNNGNTGDVTLVLYQEVGAGYELVQSTPGTNLPTRGEGTADSGTVAWLLEPGETYAIGAYLEGSWYYYYTEQGSDDPWFGTTAGSVRYEAGSAPASFQADLEGYYYDLVIDSEPADSDGDGEITDAAGGPDCDDADPEVNSAATEVPYDGIDQDCDGADLIDADGDGATAVEAGGGDCDDADPTVAPSMVDTCGDGVDQDCDGHDARCGAGDSGNGLGDVDASPDGCGCDAGSGAGAAALVIGLGALFGRRRR